MDVRQQVREFVATNFYVPDPSGLRDEESLTDRGVIDSTGVLELISFIEETLGVPVLDSEMIPENLDSIAQICDFVARKQRRVA